MPLTWWNRFWFYPACYVCCNTLKTKLHFVARKAFFPISQFSSLQCKRACIFHATCVVALQGWTVLTLTSAWQASVFKLSAIMGNCVVNCGWTKGVVMVSLYVHSFDFACLKLFCSIRLTPYLGQMSPKGECLHEEFFSRKAWIFNNGFYHFRLS